MGEVGRSLSSITTFCDEKDGPNVDSNASKDGTCDDDTDAIEVELRGDNGNLLCCCNLGLLVIEAGNPDTCDDVDAAPLADAVSCHTFDLAVLIPLRDLPDPNGVSLSFGVRFNELIRPQSLENTSFILWRILLLIASTSQSANESFDNETIPSRFTPPINPSPRRWCNPDPGVETNPTNNPPPPPPPPSLVGLGLFNLRN